MAQSWLASTVSQRSWLWQEQRSSSLPVSKSPSMELPERSSSKREHPRRIKKHTAEIITHDPIGAALFSHRARAPQTLALRKLPDHSLRCRRSCGTWSRARDTSLSHLHMFLHPEDLPGVYRQRQSRKL